MKPRPWFLVVLLILSMILTAGMRTWVQERREALEPRPKSESRLSAAPTYALGLILGGLRGPLVMILWTTSENQKVDKNLEGIDTKIELIRMLQSQFDSVIIFQAWNKAYNLSVQMASLANKYSTIIDAVNFCQKADQERPDNINILVTLADLYGRKLGGSQEKKYYTARMRQESMPRAPGVRMREGWERIEQRPVLDGTSHILAEYVRPRTALGSAEAGIEQYDGSALQYLKPYNTVEAGGFPYGIPPQAMGYNYYMRGAMLGRTTTQRHLQMSDTVVDSRPALNLKDWSDEEWERARRQEILALGKQVPEERLAMENVTADVKLDGKFADNSEKTKKLVEEALFEYRRSSLLAGDAIAEYKRHITNPNYASSADIYRSHIATEMMVEALCAADRDYLELLAGSAGMRTLSSDQKRELTERAKKNYSLSMDRNYVLILKYYMDDAIAEPVYADFTQRTLGRKLDRAHIDEAGDTKIFPELLKASRAYMQINKLKESNAEDIQEYETYIQRAQQRLSAFGAGWVRATGKANDTGDRMAGS